MNTAVGIDLGTTNSVVAWVGEDGRPLVLRKGPPDDVLRGLGDPITPSVVYFAPEGKTLVGREAKEAQERGAHGVASFFKRQMGDPHFLFHAAGKDWTASQLSAFVLEDLKRTAEGHLGHPVTEAVITVPAYFRDPHRKATMEAGRMAGLKVLQVINEPTAAAIAYGMKGLPSTQRILVYDLGGGTFDVTLLEASPKGIRVLSSDGNHELGGKDWDDRIIDYLGQRFEDEYGDNPLEDVVTRGEVLVLAENAKKALSTRSSTTVSITHGGRKGSYVLDRDTFGRITSDLLESTAALVEKVLRDQRQRPEDIGGVLLVGGSTRMPTVRAYVEHAFGKPPLSGIDPDLSVAMGAALVAHAGKPSFQLGGQVRDVVDVTSHSLGMIAVNERRDAYLNTIILPRDRAIPCVQTRPYKHRTRARGENKVEIFMTQGETASPGDVTYLGRHVIREVPHGPEGEAVLDISYHYDVSGTVQVVARVRGSDRPLKIEVEALPPDVPDRFLRRPEEIVVPRHVTAYLCFDLSGSMSGAPLHEAQAAAAEFVGQTDLSHCSVGLMAVADQSMVVLEACQDANSILKAVRSLNIGMVGFGNRAHPFDLARARIESADGAAFLIVLADGVWTDQPSAVAAAKRCHATGIEIIAIGFGGADQAFLKAIASSDTGAFYTSLGSLVSTFSTIAQVIAESPGTQTPGAKLSWLDRLKGR